jgi:hypothetical protein
VFTLGVTVGAYWEIFEWFFVGQYTLADTMSDLLVDSAGALAVTLALRRRGDRLTQVSLGQTSENSMRPRGWVNDGRSAVAGTSATGSPYLDAVKLRASRRGGVYGWSGKRHV